MYRKRTVGITASVCHLMIFIFFNHQTMSLSQLPKIAVATSSTSGLTVHSTCTTTAEPEVGK